MKSTFVKHLLLVAVCAILFAPPALMASDQQKRHQAADQIRKPQSGDSDSLASPGIDMDTTDGTPTIFFPDSSFNFGTAGQHEHLTHIFTVRNVGDAPLKIISARAS